LTGYIMTLPVFASSYEWLGGDEGRMCG
jgi:hypothetical protein